MKGQLLRSWMIGACMAAVVMTASVKVAAQGLTVAEAAPFMGSWTLELDTPQGPFAMVLTVKDAGGTVSSEIASDMMGVQPITDIAKANDSLVLKYTIDMQGSELPIKITLTPDGKTMKYLFDADGQMSAEGTATKKP